MASGTMIACLAAIHNTKSAAAIAATMAIKLEFARRVLASPGREEIPGGVGTAVFLAPVRVEMESMSASQVLRISESGKTIFGSGV